MRRITTIFIMVLSGYVAALSADVKLPPIIEKTLSNGLDVVLVENHELPVVYMKMVLKSGSLYDPRGKGGLASFTAGLLKKGTESRGAVEIAEEIDFVGGTLDASANRDAIYVSAQVLLKHFDVGLDLLADIILNPVFDDDEIERFRKQTLSGIIQSKENPGRVCAEAFDRMLFGTHPYGHPVGGTTKSVEAITRKDVIGFHGTYFKTNNAFLVVAGDVLPNDAIPKISRAFAGWGTGEIPILSLTTPNPPEGYEILLINKPDATQTNIRFGNFGITRRGDDYYQFLVMNYILGSGISFVNRLMQQVRDEAGLTYDIRTVNEFNILPGAFYCRTFTENESTLKAIEASIRIMKDMAENEVSDEEYKNAISFYTGFYPTTLETPSEVANEIIKVRLYGLPLSYIEDFTENIRKVKKEDILRVARSIIDTDNMVFSVVSNAADVEDDLKKLGRVTVKDIDEL